MYGLLKHLLSGVFRSVAETGGIYAVPTEHTDRDRSKRIKRHVAKVRSNAFFWSGLLSVFPSPIFAIPEYTHEQLGFMGNK